jgi:hypothetical protein
LRRTITTLSRFTTYTTSWLVKSASLFLAILFLLSCEDDTGLVGFKNPNRDFSVYAKEFTIPTKLFLMDSVATTNSGNSAETRRILAGVSEDPRFGKTTAIGYMQYYALGIPDTVDANAVFQSIQLTMIYDYYWEGNADAADQVYDFYELGDSVLTYLPRFASQGVALGNKLGSATKFTVPTQFDQSVKDNADTDTSNDIIDSLNVTLDPGFGQRLLNQAMDTVGTNELIYQQFYKFRRIFKGLAIVPANANKIVGFNPEHAKFRMTLTYKHGKNIKRLYYYFNPSGQASVSIGEYPSHSQLITDRSGSPLSGLGPKYQDFDPGNGLRYIQAGTGVIAKLDFSEVYEYFKDIPLKAMSVAELKIDTDEQAKAPTKFLLRALKPNNRMLLATKGDVDAVNDPITILDTDLVSRHAVYQNSLTRMEPVGDDGGLFTLNQSSNSGGTAQYLGYLTNFLQQETTLSGTDFLRYYALIPHTPENTKSLTGFHFPADKITLKIYYTTPEVEE